MSIITTREARPLLKELIYLNTTVIKIIAPKTYQLWSPCSKKNKPSTLRNHLLAYKGPLVSWDPS